MAKKTKKAAVNGKKAKSKNRKPSAPSAKKAKDKKVLAKTGGKPKAAKLKPQPKKSVLKKAAKAVKKIVAKALKPKAAKPAAATKPVKPAKAVKPAEKINKKELLKSNGKGAPNEAVIEPALPILEEELEDTEIVLTDAEGNRYCRVKDCDQLASVDVYCRYHYLMFWKKIQVRKKILSEGKLERYIEELTARYPDKFLEILRKDLRSEKDFLAAIQELEIDESAVDSEFEDEAQTYIDEVRGMGETAASARDDEDF